jgi:chromosome segregation ATPase
MAPKNKSTAVGTSPVAINGANGAAPQPNYVHLVQNFLTSIQTLSSDNSFQELDHLISKIPRLEDDIQSRDKEVAKLNSDIKNLKTEHDAVVQQQLDVYSKSRENLNGKLTSLEADVSSLKGTVKERDNKIAELEKKDGDTQKSISKLGKMLEGNNEAINKLKRREGELLSEQNERDVRIEELEQNLKREKNQVSELEKRLSTLKEENSSLRNQFEASSARLKKLEDLAEPLHPADIDLS